MKRALIWLCWGAQFVQDVVESAHSAAKVDADRFLITDQPEALSAEQSKKFSSIVSMRLLHGNNLEKSRLIEFLPAGYESFLYLDSDTRIIGDLTLGFEKAETHGIAAVPAPNYNLTEYFGFGRVMQQAGLKSLIS